MRNRLTSYKGIEGVKRAEIWLNEFQDELNNSESMKDVSIHWQWMPSETFNSKIGDERGQGGHFTTRTPKDPPEHKWIKAMESFRDQLGKIHDKIKNDGSRPRQVKVMTSMNRFSRIRVSVHGC